MANEQVVEQKVAAVDPNPETKVEDSKPINDDALVEYQVRGETVRKPWKEVKGGFMMQEDYTRSKQELSARAKEIEGIFEVVKGQKAELEARSKMIESILGKGNSTPNKTQPADDEVITVAQARELFKSDLDAIRNENKANLERTTQEQNQQRMFEHFESLTQDTLKSVKKEYPILKRIPHLDVAIKREALKDKPETDEEMVSAYVKAAEKLAKGFDEEFDARQKELAKGKQKLTDTRPDKVTTGQPVFSTQKDYMRKDNVRKVDWNQIEKDVEAALHDIGEE